MHKLKRLTVSALAMAAIVLAAPGLFGADGNDRNDKRRNPVVISMIDDCDPSDPNWAPIGCLQRKGDVTAAEFGMLLRSPLYDNISPFDAEPGRFLVGHPSWRNEPSHLVVRAGREIRVKNDGGRPHTFTPVAEFGGGVVGGSMSAHRRRPAAPDWLS